jgi:hypothetical protein
MPSRCGRKNINNLLRKPNKVGLISPALGGNGGRFLRLVSLKARYGVPLGRFRQLSSAR